MDAANGSVGIEQNTKVFVKGQDGRSYVLTPDILEAFSLSGCLLLTVGDKSYAIPRAVVEQQPVSDDDRPAVEEVLDKQDLPNQDNGKTVWNLVPYAACFWGAWPGGGDAVAAANYCEAKYPF